MRSLWCLLLVFCAGASAVNDDAHYAVAAVERGESSLINLPLPLQLDILRRSSAKDVQAMRAVHPWLNAAVLSDPSLPYWGERLKNALENKNAKERCLVMLQCSVQALKHMAELLELYVDGSLTSAEMLHFDQLFAASGLTYNLVIVDQAIWISFSALRALHTLTITGIKMECLSAFLLPLNLKALVLEQVEMTYLDASYVPPGVERLSLHDNLFFELRHVHLLSHLQVLEITENAQIVDLPRTADAWPPVLRVLRVPWPDHLIESKAYSFPDTLEVLDLSHSPISTLSHLNLPVHLRHLNLSNTDVTTLEGVDLPKGLVTLKLSGTKIKSLAGLVYPATLRVLDLRKTQIESIDTEGMPEELDILLH